VHFEHAKPQLPASHTTKNKTQVLDLHQKPNSKLRHQQIILKIWSFKSEGSIPALSAGPPHQLQQFVEHKAYAGPQL
jgi:hypothetical protein